MAEYNIHSPSKKEREQHDLVYDAWHDRYVRRDGSDSPAPRFGMTEQTSRDGLRKTFTRGAPKTPDAHQQVSAEKLAYDSMFDNGYQENEPYRETKGLARWLFGK